MVLVKRGQRPKSRKVSSLVVVAVESLNGSPIIALTVNFKQLWTRAGLTDLMETVRHRITLTLTSVHSYRYLTLHIVVAMAREIS